MRSKVFIVGSIILVLLIARLVFKQVNKYKQERKWYVENLNYDFTAVVDSLQYLNNKSGGFLMCKTIKGMINKAAEDSLEEYVTHHERLRFIFFTKRGEMAKLSWKINNYKTGDSLYVNSRKDYFKISRNGVILTEGKISDDLHTDIF